MANCKRLRDPHLNVSASPAEGELARALERVGNEEPVEQLAGLRRVLDGLRGCRRCAATGNPRTLDLIAHANQTRLLQLGTSVVDPSEPEVRQLFQGIAADGVLHSLHIGELRLLGCETAMSSEGQAAIRELTDILGIRVVGTTKLVYAAYFDDKGLKDRYERMLCDATSLPDLAELDEGRMQWPQDPLPALAPKFELDALESVPAEELPPVSWPRVGQDADHRPSARRAAEARPLVDLIDGEDGRVMPRMLARPRCEVLVDSGAERVHRVEVLFDYDLVRVHPTEAAGGAVYRVKNPQELEAWVDSVGS